MKLFSHFVSFFSWSGSRTDAVATFDAKLNTILFLYANIYKPHKKSKLHLKYEV